LVACLVAAPMYAQTPPEPRRKFVAISFGADRDDLYNRNRRARDTTLASALAWGFDARTWGFELDVTVPQWHEKRSQTQRYRYAGRSFGWQQQNHTYESSSMVRRRSIDVTALIRANSAINQRVTVTWLIGGGYVVRPERSTGVTKEVLPDGRLVEVHVRNEMSFRNYIAAATRLDVELKVASRVSIVPRVRVTVFPSLRDTSGLAPRVVVARPEVGVRWMLGRSAR
jgi:hypothetical protein